MKVLALDFSWRNVGYVIVGEGGKPEKWGVIKTKPRKKRNKSDNNKLDDIKHELENYNIIYEEVSKLPGYMSREHLRVIAEVTYFSQKATDGILIGLGWSLLHRLGAEFFIGSQVKQLLLGSKTASKIKISKYVYEHGGLKLMMEKDHIKDAYATYLAWNKLQNLKQLTR